MINTFVWEGKKSRVKDMKAKKKVDVGYKIY